MTAVLITGMSGTGKSTVLAELAGRGHRVVDTDHDGWIVPAPDGEPLWDEPRMRALLDDAGEGTLFVAGCVANQGRFADRFAAVVLLSLPGRVLLDRIASRTTNGFGKAAAEREAIIADLHAVEPLLRRSASDEIDTRLPLGEVAGRLESIAGSR